MRRSPSLLTTLLVAALALAVAVPASALAVPPAAPTAQTQPPTDVLTTQATLVATVNPEGSATSVHFEIGTSTSYGLQSASKDVGSGTDPVAVQIPVQSLEAATTYHVRVVATSTAGTTDGSDVTFTTAPQPAAPYISGTAAQDVTLATATVVGQVTPRGADTTYHFEYGTTTSYGTSTPAASAGDGWGPVAVSAQLAGLTQGKTYHYRLVATNANGTTRGDDHRLVVLATPTAASLAASKYLVPYGGSVKLNGALAGSKRSGVRVRLQLTPFPFDQPFADVATTTSSSRGAYNFTVPNVATTFRAVVIGAGIPDVLSPILTIRVSLVTGLASVRTTTKRLTVRGTVTPATPQGTVSLQRSTRGGRWTPVARRPVRADGSYAIAVSRSRRAAYYRVVGVAHDGGGHASSASRTVWVAAAPRHHHR